VSIDNIHQLIAWKSPYKGVPIISRGILLPRTRLFLFGSPKTWKSMTSVHTAFTIAEGLPWFGLRTSKATILKVQAELPKMVDRERILKYQNHNNSKPDNIFFKTPQERYKLDTTWGYNALSRDVDEVLARAPDTPLVVILDPLYKMFAGKITDEYDVKKFQDNMDELINRKGISLILVHHSRKSKGETDQEGRLIDMGAEEAIGSSYWGNWCDTMIRLRLLNPYAGKNEVAFSFEYTRNAEDFLPNFTVRWERATLHPTILKKDSDYTEREPSVRNLEEE